ncbi:MAG TPA: MFS transporter [Terriglobales bacterium]|jgi:MFS family permease|nr:MFS transporter [Terriglobales bacterium]
MPESPRSEPSRAYRWIVLIFLSIAMGGNYYIYDSINPLERIFIEHLGYSGTRFGWLNSSYSVAAVLTLLIGGIIIDKIGTKKALFIFSVLCLIGAVLTAAKGSFGIMVAGRTVLGLGAESMIVAVTTALAKWFKGKELSFAFGVNLTIARLASVAADNSPTWAHSAFYPQGAAGPPSWRGPLMIAVGAGVLSVVCAIVYWILESRAEQRYQLGKAGEVDKLQMRGILRFDLSYWYVVGLCFTFYSAIFPFRTFAIDFFTNKLLAQHGGAMASEAARIVSHERAGFFNSLLPLSAMIVTPWFGLLSDKVGKRALFMMLGSVLLMPVYLLMAYTNVSLWLPVSLMGIAFSLIPAVMWPSVAYIVEQARLGTAYALMTLFQQVGFFIMNLLIGKANDFAGAGLQNPGGYALGMWIFSVLGFVGLALSILLKIRETGPHGHGLETITTATAAGLV